jgi:uncharacterized membrane protein YraQ (UPF0718 family)
MKISYKKPAIVVLLLAVWFIIYHYLQPLTNLIVLDLFGMKAGTKLAETLRFFLFEVPKVLMLIVLIIFVVGIIRSYITPEKTRKVIEGKPLFIGNILAAMTGIITPFCSCSAIPLFLGFVETGIPLGVTFSFLIAAPMINEVALVLLLSLFGIRVAIIYVVTGLVIAIMAGFILEKLNLQRFVAPWVYEVKAKHTAVQQLEMNSGDRIDAGYEAVKDIMGKIWIYVIAGIAIGAAAHGYVPGDFLASTLGNKHWYSVPLAIIVGVPLYSSAVAIIPVISVLIEKGVSLGTALAFMMSVIGLSLPEMIILKKVLRWQLIAIFAGIVASGIIIVGYLFNAVM